METTFLSVDSRTSLFLPNAREVIVMPIGDIQLGAEGCDLPRLRRHIEWGVNNGAYYIGMGDYTDLESPSNRAMLAPLYDSVHDALDAQAAKHQKILEQIFAPTKGRWLGLHEGHHTHKFQTGATLDMELCKYLEAPFLGRCAVSIIKLGDPDHSVQCRIWSHHGEGSAQTLAGPLAKLERLSNHFDADIMLMAHYTRKLATKIPRLYFRLKKNGEVAITSRNRILATTGGFFKGYTHKSNRGGKPEGSYVEKTMLPPTAEGSVVLYIRAKRGTRGPTRLDLDVSL